MAERALADGAIAEGEGSEDVVRRLGSLVGQEASAALIRDYLLGAFAALDLEDILLTAAQQLSDSDGFPLEALAHLASAVVYSMAVGQDGVAFSVEDKKDMTQVLITALIMPNPPFLRSEDLELFEQTICSAEPELYFELYKLTAAAAYATVHVPGLALKDRCAIAYRSLGILARRLRDCSADQTAAGAAASPAVADQWALLEALNITKPAKVPLPGMPVGFKITFKE
jgi:hypothetical protein